MSSRSELIINARAIIAEQGLQGLSLRAVAERAGISLGSLNYQIGDRAALIEAVLADGLEALTGWHDQWITRLDGLPVPDAAMLASIVTAYLEAAADQQPALTACLAELLLWAGQEGGGVVLFTAIVAENARFWQAVLAGHPDADRLAAAIAAYCQDEKIFTLALRHLPEYRLLRDATVARLAAGFAPSGPYRDSALFERLVAAAAVPAAGVGMRVDLGTERRAAIADWAADIIADQGVGALTHRAVAALGQVPPSSVAHHFATKDDLLRAGIEAQYRRMTGARIGSPDQHSRADAARSGRAVMRITHVMALAACRDPAFIPYAIDMRRRRSENVRPRISAAISGGPDLDWAAIQAVVIAGLGAVLNADAVGRDGWAQAPNFHRILRLPGVEDAVHVI